jgi:hypothetical protein
MIQYKQILTTLVLLLTAASGAWAQATLGVKEITPDMVPDSWNGDDTEVTAEDLAKWGFVEVTQAEALTWTGAPQQGTVRLIYSISSGSKSLDWVGGVQNGEASDYTHRQIYNLVCNPQYSSSFDVFITIEPPLKVTWNAATKTGTFVMPDCDVEIAPIYAPVAAFDLKEGSEDKLPAAVEGIFIGSTDAIITAGSCAQGTLMYAVSTSGTEQPALTAFSADLPTAKDITTAGDVYVWYYIKGADTPEGQEPTEKNTFNDSEIYTTPLKVTVLNNKFNILFTAANANTIEAGKATVTVGGTAATVTEGKLEGVKMGSEVKVTAKEGYKIKSVTAKKTGAEETVTVTINDAKTEASFDMPTNDVTVNYELIRDMTVAVSAKVGDGTDGYRFSIYKKESGQYDLVDDAADYPVIMDNIDTKNPAEVAAKDYELQLQKLGDDGKTWTNTADYSPGTFRLMVTGKEGYDGTIYTNTYVLYEQTSITFAKGYSTHYYTESLVLDEKQDGLKFYAVTAVTDEKVTLTEIEAKAIPAETPFIAYNAGAEAVTAKMGLLKADDVTSAEEFKGTAEDKTMAAQSGCYVLRNGDTTPTFRLVEGAGTLPAHRCWIELGTAAGTRSLGFDFSDGTTGMSEALRVKSEESAGDWYDLQGRKLQGAPLRKGAYIHNGKTIIIK